MRMETFLAKQISNLFMKINVVLEKSDDGWITATVPTLPGCISQGKTEKEALANIQEAIELHLEMLNEEAKTSGKIIKTIDIPTPA